jgi:D-serine deaminase-like pyridoxal phosphate-dependent protein
MSIKRQTRRAQFIARGVMALGGRAGLPPRDRGEGGHDPYFTDLSAALHRAGIAEPTLVIDRARLEANIVTVRDALAPTGLGLRVVTKSLQAPALLQAVLTGCGTTRLMVFNGVMLDEMAHVHPASDVLLGRPLPAAQVDSFVRRHGNAPAAAARPQWLVDSPARLAQYAAIARAHDAPMRISLEIDVGMHRGGLPDSAAVAAVIDLAAAEPLLEVTGLMGYDAHVPGMGSPQAEMARVRTRYAEARAVLMAKLGGDPHARTFNAAGSPTYRMHLDGSPANEVSIGSAFVKPMNFDYGLLRSHLPAAFIVQPVLKALDQALIPTIEPYAEMLNALDPNSRRGFFLYGGYGDAEPVSPPGLAFSPLYGGRGMLTGSAKVNLQQDDFVFFRPRESEGVFLQYGDIAIYDRGEIAERWPTFPVAA